MTIVLIILAVIVLMMLIRSFRQRKEQANQETQNAQASQQSSELSLDNLAPGGILSIMDTDYLVEEKSRYEAGNSEWFEAKLSGDDDQEWWLNWEPGATDVSLTSEISFQDLGITPDDLERFVADGQGEIEYEDTTYYLDEFGEADYYRQEGSQGEELAYCDFLTEDERQTVGIVQWASGAFDAYAGIILPRHQVEVLRNRAEEGEEWS